MRRVVVLGRGGAGKSTVARQLGARTGLPVVELDDLFWDADVRGMRLDEWRMLQERLAAADAWILEGDLGPYDDPTPRLTRADTVVVLDLPLRVCGPRVLRRGRERFDFWRWMLAWRRRSRPRLVKAIATHAGEADLIELDSTDAVASWLNGQE